jgi:hypothetical protein
MSDLILAQRILAVKAHHAPYIGVDLFLGVHSFMMMVVVPRAIAIIFMLISLFFRHFDTEAVAFKYSLIDCLTVAFEPFNP